MRKKELQVAGISYISDQSQSYQLLMYSEETNLNIPIVIGVFEVQSIAIQLENMKPPRPLTHDLFTTIFDEFGIYLNEVYIYHLDEGIFYSQLLFNNGSVIECRTSDAISIALRVNVPIFVDIDILYKVGFESNEIKKEAKKNNSNDDLETELKKAIDHEDYEKAAEIKSRMNKN